MHRAILTPREQRSEPSGEPDRYTAARRGAAAAKQISDLKISRAECEKLQAALAAAEKKRRGRCGGAPPTPTPSDSP